MSLAVGLLALTGIAAYQVSAIIRHPHSAVRAIEALAITVPLFLLLFAATYFLMAQANTDNLNVHWWRAGLRWFIAAPPGSWRRSLRSLP
jgi:hypothetical protein